MAALVNKEKHKTEEQVEKFLDDVINDPINDDEIIQVLLNPTTSEENRDAVRILPTPQEAVNNPPASASNSVASATSEGQPTEKSDSKTKLASSYRTGGGIKMRNKSTQTPGRSNRTPSPKGFRQRQDRPRRSRSPVAPRDQPKQARWDFRKGRSPDSTRGKGNKKSSEKPREPRRSRSPQPMTPGERAAIKEVLKMAEQRGGIQKMMQDL